MLITVHNPNEPGGNVGSKASLGLRRGFLNPISMIDGGKFDADKAYKDSKLCNVMMCLELARRLQQSGSNATCNCLNPGLIPTSGLFRNFNPLVLLIFNFFATTVLQVAVSIDVGGARLAYLIDSPDCKNITGAYYLAQKNDAGIITPQVPSNEARDILKAALLWKLSSDLVSNN